MIPSQLNSLTWQVLFEALRQDPERQRLEALASRHPDTPELQALCNFHGILPLVDRGIGPVRDLLLESGAQERWRREVAGCVHGSLLRYRELKRLLPLFAAATLRVVPLKGPELSERLYGDPLLRTVSDLDLLVHPRDVPAAVALLEDEGYMADSGCSMLRGDVETENAAYHCTLLHPEEHWPVELHWSLTYAWLRMRFSQELQDRWLEAGQPGDEELLLYLCMHGATHFWLKIKWVADIDRCVRSAPSLDWDRLLAMARQQGCVRILHLGLYLARAVCGLSFTASVVAEMERDPAVPVLARRSMALWDVDENPSPGYFWKARYILTCRENPTDRIGMVRDYLVSR